MIRLEHPDLDPLELDGWEDGFICEELDLGWPVTRTVTQGRPRADGTTDDTAYFGARAVSARLAVFEARDFTRRQNLDRLAQFCHPGMRPTMTWQHEPDDEPRRVVLRADQGSMPLSDPDVTMVQVQWVAPSGVIESAAQHLAILVPSGVAPGWSPPLVPPLVFPAHVGSGPSLVMNQGSTPAGWQAAIFGPCTGPRIRNRTSGEELSFPGLTIAAGDHLWIDQVERAVLLNGQRAAPRYSWLDFAGSEWFPLGPGGQMLEFDAESSAAPASVWLTWRDTYLT